MIEKIKNPTPESEDDKRSKDFLSYVRLNNVSADVLEKEYFRVCGVEEKEPNGSELFLKMQEMVNDGFPLNRFTTVIEVLGSLENAKDNLEKYIDTLDISENEKYVLNSIVKKRRKGTLTLFRLNGHVEIAKTVIPDLPIGDENMYYVQFQQELMQILGLVKNQKIEFEFEED